MTNFTYNPNQFTERNFTLIPEGNHRVRVTNVIEKTFSTGNEGFEITFDVYGFNSKLWYCMIIDQVDVQKTNQRLGMFFSSFDIKDYDLSNYKEWVGKVGAVRVNHNSYQNNVVARVAFCLSRSQQANMPNFDTTQAYTSTIVQKLTTPQPAEPERPPRNFTGFQF